MEKKLDGYTRILWAILNKSWKQYPTEQQLYVHLPPITKTIQVRWTRHAGNCSRSRDEVISDILLWIPSHGWAKAGWPAGSYIQQLCANMGCDLEDLLEVMDDREEWWRCPWCSCYRRRKWTRRHEFNSWTDCISHSTNTLGKGMNPIILSPAMGK